jgi:hypothetical protein
MSPSKVSTTGKAVKEPPKYCLCNLAALSNNLACK